MLGVHRIWRQMESSWVMVACEIQVGWGSHYSLGMTHKSSSLLPTSWKDYHQITWLSTHLPGTLPGSQKMKLRSLLAPRNMELLGSIQSLWVT